MVLTMKVIDLLLAPVIAVLLLPLILVIAFIIYWEDKKFPFYISKRIGKGGKEFKIYKFRSMYINNNSTVDSTSNNDTRITKTGRWIRKYKIDEIPQIINVIMGDMSLVGPRPNVPREVALYTATEMNLLNVKPGVTDLSSIIFSDLGAILVEYEDPDIAYNQLVRPWKSRLGLFYIDKYSVSLDLTILALTAVAILSRKISLKLTSQVLIFLEAHDDLVNFSHRNFKLSPLPPIGSDKIVERRKVS